MSRSAVRGTARWSPSSTPFTTSRQMKIVNLKFEKEEKELANARHCKTIAIQILIPNRHGFAVTSIRKFLVFLRKLQPLYLHLHECCLEVETVNLCLKGSVRQSLFLRCCSDLCSHFLDEDFLALGNRFTSRQLLLSHRGIPAYSSRKQSFIAEIHFHSLHDIETKATS